MPFLHLSRLTMTPIIPPVCTNLLFNFRASCRPSPLASPPPPRHRVAAAASLSIVFVIILGWAEAANGQPCHVHLRPSSHGPPFRSRRRKVVKEKDISEKCCLTRTNVVNINSAAARNNVEDRHRFSLVLEIPRRHWPHSRRILSQVPTSPCAEVERC